MNDSLRLTELYASIQGESTAAGRPCVLVRLSGCPLRCSYCDTTFAFEEGEEVKIVDLLSRIAAFGISLVELTGGEPLAQGGSLELVQILCDQNYEVLIETGGAVSTQGVDHRARIILDIKTPDSGMQNKQDWDNLNRLRPHDEIKFVICSRQDYEWSRDFVLQKQLAAVHTILFSPVEQIPTSSEQTFSGVTKQELAEWILEDRLKVRLNLQLHLWIWGQGVRQV